MKQVLLVNPQSNWDRDNEIFPRLSLLLLGTMLRRKGYAAEIIHMVADNVSVEDTVKMVKESDIRTVGITATTYQTKYTKLLSRRLKEEVKDVRIVLGGPHIAAVKSLQDFPHIDIGVLGEGERSFIDILEGKSYKDIKGIMYRQDNNVVVTEKDSYIDLDSLPFPDPRLVDLKNFSGPNPIGRSRNMQIMASRGCPFNCTFCCKPIYGREVRFHSPQYILEEVEFLHQCFGIEELCFQDDTFNLKSDWMANILEGLIAKGFSKKMIFRVGFRADEKLVTQELLQLAKRAGVWLIFFGVESGNQYMLDRMQKNISLEAIQRAFHLCHKVGIKAEAPFILGLPGETEDTIKENLRFWKTLGSYSSWFSRAMPFPGTVFREEVIAKGHLVAGDWDDYSPTKPRVRTDALTVEDLEWWYKYCNKIMLSDMMWQAIKDPQLLYRTLKGFGPKEIVTKMLRNV